MKETYTTLLITIYVPHQHTISSYEILIEKCEQYCKSVLWFLLMGFDGSAFAALCSESPATDRC